MLCCAAYGKAVSIMSCLANKRHNNGGFTARRRASTRGIGNGRGFGAHIKMSDNTPHGVTNMFHSHILSRHIYTCMHTKNCAVCSWGEYTETHTHSRAAKGQGTHCHTHCLKCHTQASLGVWRAEGSCQVGGRFVPPDTACRICWKQGTRAHTHIQTHTHSKRLSTQSLNNLSMSVLKTYTLSGCRCKVLWIKSRCRVKDKLCAVTGHKN